jgi:hypothetical protein
MREREGDADPPQRPIMQAKQAIVDPLAARGVEHKAAGEIGAEVAGPAGAHPQAVQRQRGVEDRAGYHVEAGAEQVRAQARQLRQAGEDQVTEVAVG